MATPVQVKPEPVDGDVFSVDTDSEEDDIDIDKLQPLAPKFTSLSKFPIGCQVWYKLRTSPETGHMQAKSARVAEVSLHFENGRRVYKVKPESSEQKIPFYEDQLFYARGCPVSITKIEDTNEKLDGVVAFLELEKINGRRNVMYAVEYTKDDYVTIEPRVVANRLKYREEVCGVGVGGAESSTSSDTQKQTASCKHEGDTDKEEKEADASSHSSSAESFPHTDNDSNSTLSDSRDTAESPPPKQKRKRTRKRSSGSGPKSVVNDRPNKLAKRDARCNDEGELKRDESMEKRGNTDAVLILTIPSWWMYQWGKENRRQLHCKSFDDRRGVQLFSTSSNSFFTLVAAHLIGKAKSIKASNNCIILISGHDTNERMRITIKSLSRDPKAKLNGIIRTNRVIEKSLVEYLACEHSEKRLLHDLAASAVDSCQLIQRDINSGLLQRESHGIRISQQWWRLFELPCGRGPHPHDLSFLEELRVPKGIDCKIELFRRSTKVPLASPYVLISGTKHPDVKSTALMVADAVRRHQRFCPCQPKW